MLRWLMPSAGIPFNFFPLANPGATMIADQYWFMSLAIVIIVVSASKVTHRDNSNRHHLSQVSLDLKVLARKE